MSRLAAQPQYLFTRFGTRDGLASDKIMAVQQDEKGFIWIATNNCLQRYDGQRFLSFYHQPGNPRSAPEGLINQMRMDNKGRLWLLTTDLQIGYFSTADFTFHEVPVKFSRDSLAKSLHRYYTDINGNIILLSWAFGFFHYDEKEGVFTLQNSALRLPQGWRPSSFHQDKSGNYWLGAEQGLVKYNPIKKTLSYRGHNEDKDPVIDAFSFANHVQHFYKDAKGRYWLTCWPPGGFYIVSYDSVTRAITYWQDQLAQQVRKYYELQVIKELKDGSFWIAGPNFLARLNDRRDRFEMIPRYSPDEFSIRYDAVQHLFEDREANIWVSTDRGLFRFNPSAQLFKTVSTRRPANDTAYTSLVTTILQLPNGNVMAGTWADGFFAYDSNFNPIRVDGFNLYNTGEGMPWCIYRHSSGDLWRGHQGGWAYVTRAGSRTTEKVVDSAFGRSTVRQITEDKQGNLWFGTQRGDVIKMDVATRTFTVMQTLKSIIAKLYTDREGYIWACTFNAGVFKINPTDAHIVSHYSSKSPEAQRLKMDGAFSIYQYNDSLMVIGGKGLAFLNLRTNKITHFFTDKSFLLNAVNNILPDKFGYLWITSENNLARIDIKRNVMLSFNEEDGLPSDMFGTASGTTLRDGRIAIGHAKDILVFDPSVFSSTKHPPPNVEITGFALMNEWLRMDSLRRLPDIELRHNENSIHIQFSALSYLDQFAILYQMENLDEKWISAGDRSEVNYNYLPPGKYVFKVKSVNGEGQESAVSSLIISVNAPFWKSWWFYSLVLLGIAGLLFWFDRERMLRKEAILKMRSDIAGNLHEEVNVALNNINILSEMARIKADDDPQKSKEFIEQIHSKSHNMIIAMDDMLWSIDPANDSMEKKVERIREYLDALKNRHDINVHIAVDKKVYALNLNMKQRHEAFLLFKEAIKGLVNAGARNVEVHIGLEKSKLLFAIQFDNEGCDLQELNNLLRRQDIGAKLSSINAEMDVQVYKNDSMLMLQVKVA